MSKKKLDERSAVSILLDDGCEFNGKFIKISQNGLSGLRKCSALDFLVNHCGYRA
jgi:hypothetical protein